MSTLAAIVLAWFVHEVPPERLAKVPTYPEAQETVQARQERYQALAEAIAAAVEAEGKGTREAALLAATAIQESGLRRDVDLGPCAAAWVQVGGCDRGRAKTVFQLQAVDGWPSRDDAARIALKRILHSERTCFRYPTEYRLGAYCSGRCDRPAGWVKSEKRYQLVRKLLARVRINA